MKPTPDQMIKTILNLGQKMTLKEQEYGELSERAVEAEAEYKRQLHVTRLRLKVEQAPATLIEKLAEGECVDLWLEMAKADAVRKACKESLNVMYSKMDGYRSIFSYEKECAAL